MRKLLETLMNELKDSKVVINIIKRGLICDEIVFGGVDNIRDLEYIINSVKKAIIFAEDYYVQNGCLFIITNNDIGIDLEYFNNNNVDYNNNNEEEVVMGNIYANEIAKLQEEIEKLREENKKLLEKVNKVEEELKYEKTINETLNSRLNKAIEFYRSTTNTNKNLGKNLNGSETQNQNTNTINITKISDKKPIPQEKTKQTGYTCDKCGKKITDNAFNYCKKNDHIFNGVYCFSCQKEVVKKQKAGV